MSKSVAIQKKDELEKVIPIVVASFPVEKREPDWDEEAGVTGAIEGKDENIKRLKPLQYRAISLALQGRTQSQTATELGISRSCVARWFSKGSLIREIYEDRLHKIWEAVDQKIVILYIKALEVKFESIESPDQTTRDKAASFILSKFSFPEPFNPENMSEEEREDRDRRRRYGGQYFSYQQHQEPWKGEIDRELYGERSEHDETNNCSGYGNCGAESFTLQPYEFDDFCADLDDRELNYKRMEDSILVINHNAEIIATIYSYRAEQPSIFHVDNLKHANRYSMIQCLNIEKDEYGHFKYDMCNENWLIIPRHVIKENLLHVLEHIIKEPRKYIDSL
ncbi:MAG: hypothetical protein AVO35_12750 [Candidatus Aegiribacteria sp. MLS_C]|nr:MAG: hypothetical protein AVO35_12750 [Candidatus Aegiribacteria sp. MLS_C]